MEIYETGKDRISFQYNAGQGRATMFWGDTNTDRLLRPYRRHYSQDGSMEITWEKATGKTTFVTYVGGDGYSAPAIYRSEQSSSTVAEYLYLHRDYLGSILAITDKNGNIKEKRHFDAWGNIVKLTDGNNVALTKFAILDRGYTGHEHLLGVGLVHMNGRLYDPMLHRFLMPDNYVQDPYNSLSYNRFGYAWNNPLKYTDSNGEFLWLAIGIGALIGALTGGAAYVGSAIRTGDWSWGQFGLSVLGGAVVGAITAGQLPASIGAGYVTSMVASGFAAGLLPSANFGVGNFNFSISPAIAFGNAMGIGANFSVGYNDGNFNVSAGFGASFYGRAHGTGASGWEYRKSWSAGWDDGKSGLSFYSTSFSSGVTSQRIGGMSIRSGDFGMRYENDDSYPFSFFGNAISGGTDSYRTTAFQLSYRDYSIGLNLFTGRRDYDDHTQYGFRDEFGNKFRNGVVTTEGANDFRLGALTFGYKGYRVGVDSEHVRNAAQNWFAHSILSPQAGFKNISWNWKSYFQYQTPNKYTLW